MIRARRFSAIGRDTRGNVLPLAAMGMLISLALVGGAIDMSRAYRAENRLQSACDAAVLAGRRAVGSNGFDEPAQTQARSYFTTNFDDVAQETNTTVFTPTTVDNGQTVTATATTRLNPVVMKVFGFQRFNLSVNCSAAMGVGNSDVMMVLDTTGSMGGSLGAGTRISALRTAMKNFYTTVKTATAGTNARIRYGFVPYSSTVNVGRLLYAQDPDYLVDQHWIQSREAVGDKSTEQENNAATQNVKLYSNKTFTSNKACADSMPGTTAWANNGASYALPTQTISQGTYGDQSWKTIQRQPQKRHVYGCYNHNGTYYPYDYDDLKDIDTTRVWNMEYKRLQYLVSAYKAFASASTTTGSFGAAVTSTWEGCIEERGSVNASSFSYSSINGISPQKAYDLDIDMEPTSDDETKWAPMWPELAYGRLNSSGGFDNGASSKYGYDAASYCPYQAQLLTEMSQGSFDAYADALKAEGSTYLDIGMVWGGRLASPDGIFRSNVNIAPSNGGEVSRHVIFMTDGLMEPNFSIQSAWGIEYYDRRVTDNGYSNDASRHTSRFRAICDSIKAKGIRIWTISFTTGTNSDLSYCASSDSSFNADDSTQLNEAFQEIAKQVGELRLTQ